MEKIPCPYCTGIDMIGICPICKDTGFVLVKSNVEKKKYRNDKSRKYATNANARFTKKELRLIEKYEYTASYVAKKLNRSIKSIESIRHRLKKKSEAITNAEEKS